MTLIRKENGAVAVVWKEKQLEAEGRGKERASLFQPPCKRASRVNICVGAVMLLAIAALAVISALSIVSPPNAMDIRARLVPPSKEHLLGTDHFGRDLFSRVAYGGRVALKVGLGSTVMAALLGVSLGGWAGYRGGWWDETIMRIVDGLMAFPGVLFAIMLVTVLGPGMKNTILAIGFANLPLFARITRASFLSARNTLYVEAARALGARPRHIVWRHVFPNSIGPIVVQATVTCSTAILTEASLSYLGLGIQPPYPSWGRMLKEAQPYMGRAPWLVLVPGLAVFFTVIALNLLGDGLRDWLDPNTR
ncbi:MAG: ABC transporter permease [Firmicutes bacterium]|nr:ABC transporter permease [Bacillota bacterium]